MLKMGGFSDEERWVRLEMGGIRLKIGWSLLENGSEVGLRLS